MTNDKKLYLLGLQLRFLSPNPFCCSAIAGFRNEGIQATFVNDQPLWALIEPSMKIIKEVDYCPFCGTKLPEFQKREGLKDSNFPGIWKWEVENSPPLSFVAAYIPSKENLILSVSRKNNPNSKGFPGGKIESGETLLEAIIREVKEETGLTIENAFPFFDAKDDTGIRGLTFYVTDYSGEVSTQETGVVEWVSHKTIVEQSPFSEYNRAMIGRLNLMPLLV